MAYPLFEDWRKIVVGKHLLFDSDAIISIMAFKARTLMNELKSLGVTFTFNSPIILELMNTNSEKERIVRAELLAEYDFLELPLTSIEIKNAERIQRSLPTNVKGRPSVIDLYIAGTLAHYATGKMLLLTSNTKDFPMPVFTREGFIQLFNQTDVKSISLIGFNKPELVHS